MHLPPAPSVAFIQSRCPLPRSCRGWQYVKDVEGQSVQEAVQEALQRLLDGRRATTAAAVGAAHASGGLNGSSSTSLGSSSLGGSDHSLVGSSSVSRGGSAATYRRAAKRSEAPQVVIAAAGRTDRGVHALGQVLSFYTWDASITQQARVWPIAQLRLQ